MTRPNILFILIDDLGWRDLGCYGSTFYETPNLDRLAAQGMRFTDAYAASPVCSPTRASILTGKYPARVGVTNWIPGNPWGKLMGVPYSHALPKDELTIAQVLKAHGYRTWHVGKWHLGEKGNWPEDFGFDVNIAGCHLGGPHRGGYFSPWNIDNLENGPQGEYLTDRLTDEAIRLIEQPDEHPFFLYLSHYAVHTPIQAPPELVAKYEKKAKALDLDAQETFRDGEPFPCLHKKDQRIRRRLIQSDPVYAAMVENLDTNIGRVLDALDRLGKTDDTLVIFTSDNGGLSTAEGSPTSNAPLSEGKGWMYDGGVREPLIVRWPGVIEPGSTCETPVTSPDFFPTCLEAASLPLRPERHVDGVSLAPLFRGESIHRDAIFWHYPHYSNQGDAPACAIRAGDWKLIEHFEDGRLELFNLRDDLEESRDLSSSLPERARELHARLVAWRRSIEAKIPQPNPDYEAMLAGLKPSPNGYSVVPEPARDSR